MNKEKIGVMVAAANSHLPVKVSEALIGNAITAMESGGKGFIGTLKAGLVEYFQAQGNDEKEAKKRAKAVADGVQAAYASGNSMRTQWIGAVDEAIKLGYVFDGVSKAGAPKAKKMTKAAIETMDAIKVAEAKFLDLWAGKTIEVTDAGVKEIGTGDQQAEEPQ